MDFRIRPVSAPLLLRSERPQAEGPRAKPRTAKEWTAEYREVAPICGAAFLAHVLTQAGERRGDRRGAPHALARYAGPGNPPRGRLANVKA
jgi:hypothetical protein